MQRKYMLLSILLLISTVAMALPVCPSNGGFQFPHNLFDSSVTGPAALLAQSSCTSLGITAGSRYELLAEDLQFRIFTESNFFSTAGNKPALINIRVPSDGDYVTTDTCASVTISSQQIVSPTLNLNIREDQNGVVTIQHGNETCQLRDCPKFGACN
jgi:hypothetical protein